MNILGEMVTPVKRWWRLLHETTNLRHALHRPALTQASYQKRGCGGQSVRRAREYRVNAGSDGWKTFHELGREKSFRNQENFFRL